MTHSIPHLLGRRAVFLMPFQDHPDRQGRSKPEVTAPGQMKMPPHSFRIGQTVELIPSKFFGAKHGPYTILRLLPNDGLDREYRVKHLVDGHERVVQQSEIFSGASAPRTSSVLS